jgi:mRNA-degrading endonuclease RelE of RelBE toxin-antitoxin system
MWRVVFTNRAAKQLEKLPVQIRERINFLIAEIEAAGPYRTQWKNYGKLKATGMLTRDGFHCHVKSGKPTYVVCWRIENEKIKIIEVTYAGTHENAPY